ncbi:MAG: DUF2798 domain-containing protein [Alphaproteobacteria bacterium]
MPRFPRRAEPLLFGAILSAIMSGVVSFITILRTVDLDSTFLPIWLQAWGGSWVIAFPTVLVVAPLVRLIVVRLVEQRAPEV